MTSPRSWRPPKPTTYVPLFRRFTNERARDLRETQQLYERVRARHLASQWSREDAITQFTIAVFQDLKELRPELTLTSPLFQPVVDTIEDVVALEHPIFHTPEVDFTKALTLKEHVELNGFLRAQEYFLDHEEEVAVIFGTNLRNLFDGVLSEIPAVGESIFQAPLVTVARDHRELIDAVAGTFGAERCVERGIYNHINEQIWFNFCRMNHLSPDREPQKGYKRIFEFDLPPEELLDAFLAKTPMHSFLKTVVPLDVPEEVFFSHAHVIGGSGAGKTQWLQSLILHHLDQDDPPALVIVDSQGDLIGKLLKLDVFDPDTGKLRDRLVHITPKDVEHPPAINLFDVKRDRIAAYDQAMREQVTAGVIQMFDYLFRGLLADLTAKQSVFFRMVARLMLQLPETMGRNATMLDILDLMENDEPYQAAIQSLPDIPRRFFERDFKSVKGKENAFKQTKDQIRYRLNSILENPTLARLFTNPTTKVDIFTELNRGSIILVDTAKDFLKDGSSYFGRFFIALVLSAILERAAIPEHKRRPAHLIVDEAAEYFDTNIDDLLTEARKYKMGCVFAHQYLDQCTSQLRASLAANTAIKMAGSVSMSDARALAPDLRTTSDFIMEQRRLHFACFIKDVTTRAISLPVEAGKLEDRGILTSHAQRVLKELNRQRVSDGGVVAKLTSTRAKLAIPTDDDPLADTKWRP